MKRGRGWPIAAVCGVLLVALGVLLIAVVPYRPVRVEGPRIEPRPLELPEPLAGLRLHVFNTGANRMSSLLVGPDPPWRAVPAFLIEVPGHGLVAFDLGLSHEVAESGEEAIAPPVGWLMESRGRPGLTLEFQMKEDGLSPEAVQTVILSHLHGDHTGVASAFAHASFIAGPGTRSRFLDAPDAPFGSAPAPAWQEFGVGEEDRAPSTRLGPFEAVVDLFGDGSIHLIAAGGHTDEDIMALVNLPQGPVLLTGDAVVHFDWLASDDVERIASDPERAATIRNQVRSLAAAGEVLILPGHDLRRLRETRPRSDLVLHHPERFEPSFWPIDRD